MQFMIDNPEQTVEILYEELTDTKIHDLVSDLRGESVAIMAIP